MKKKTMIELAETLLISVLSFVAEHDATNLQKITRSSMPKLRLTACNDR